MGHIEGLRFLQLSYLLGSRKPLSMLCQEMPSFLMFLCHMSPWDVQGEMQSYSGEKASLHGNLWVTSALGSRKQWGVPVH